MNLYSSLFVASALAFVSACAAKAPSTPIATKHASASAESTAVDQKSVDVDPTTTEDDFAVAKVAAAEFLIAHHGASDDEAIAVATTAARQAGDPDAKTTGKYAESDAKDWVDTRRSNGFPPRSTSAELAANDAAADAAARKMIAEMPPAQQKLLGAVDAEPDEPSRGAHFFPKVGSCFDTQVASIGSRLENTPDSGDSVNYTDGHYQVSYDKSPAVREFRVGDPIHLCVTDLPGHCPPTDDRGIGFVAVDGRTGGHWEAGDSEHQCGGA